MTWLSRCGGRKFVAAMSCLAVLSLLVAFGKISDVVFGYALVMNVSAYITGNVIQKTVTKGSA